MARGNRWKAAWQPAGRPRDNPMFAPLLLLPLPMLHRATPLLLHDLILVVYAILCCCYLCRSYPLFNYYLEMRLMRRVSEGKSSGGQWKGLISSVSWPRALESFPLLRFEGFSSCNYFCPVYALYLLF